jgi:histidinol-phosphate/aromatic aminotransferase/cobyric acid decarboxylase-like protein
MTQRNENARGAFHGGGSFEAVGEDLQHLERAREIVRADVLDAWFEPSPRVLRTLRDHLPFLTAASPPTYASGLVARIAESRGVCADSILTGGGSSDLIFACVPRLVSRGERVVILDPTYGEYLHVLRDLIGADVIRCDLRKEDGFRIDTEALIEQVLEAAPRLVVMVNPNSPTGRYWPRCEVHRLLEHLPPDSRLLVDETYLEFAEAGVSLEREACEKSNVIVLKSMSKVYALSGLRVGYLVGHPETIRELRPWLPPWGVSLPAQAAAIEALSDSDYYKARYAETRMHRRALIDSLRANRDLCVYDSDINLVLVETGTSARRIAEKMQSGNVYVRNCDSMSERFRDCLLRIAVKDPATNLRTCSALFAAMEHREEPDGLPA